MADHKYAEDVKKVFNKYHPETTRKIEKGKKKVDKIIKKLKTHNFHNK